MKVLVPADAQRGMAPPAREAVQAAPLPMTLFGQRIRTGAGRVSYSLRRQGAPAYLAAFIGGPPFSSSELPDLPALATALSGAADLCGSVLPMCADVPGLAAVERDEFSKICLQSGGPPGWFVQPAGLSRHHDFDYARWVGAIMDEMTVVTPYERHAPRRNTNHGYPTWRTDDADMAVHALIARAGVNFDAAAGVARGLAGALECRVGPCNTSNSRTGPTNKILDAYTITGAGPVLTWKLQSLACRRRLVNMAPFWTLQLMRPIYAALVERFWATAAAGGLLTRTRTAALIAHWDAGLTISDDISSFDLMVPFELQRALFLTLRDRFPALRDAAAAWFAEEQLPLLAPPHYTGDEAFLYESIGTTKSGHLLTSVAGSLYNLARVAFCLHATCGYNTARAARYAVHSGSVLVWGDDVTLQLPGRTRLDRWAEASAEFGLPCKVAPGAIFLRKTYSGGHAAPLAARLVQQTVFNEHAPRTQNLELLGLWSRTIGLEHHPAHAVLADWLAERAIMRAFSLRTANDLRRFILTPAFQHACQLDAARVGMQASDWAAASTPTAEMDAYLGLTGRPPPPWLKAIEALASADAQRLLHSLIGPLLMELDIKDRLNKALGTRMSD